MSETGKRDASTFRDASGWTPVTVALPRTSGYVLAWHAELAHIVLEFCVADPVAARWYTLGCESVASSDILAWQPLPPDYLPDACRDDTPGDSSGG